MQSLQAIQSQYRTGVGGRHFDVLAAVCEGGCHCVDVGSFREGASHGHRSYFPQGMDPKAEAPQLLRAFIGQYYLDRAAPPEILLSHPVSEQSLLEEWLSERTQAKVRLHARVRGRRRAQVDLALRNAQQAIAVRAQSRAGIGERLEALAQALLLDSVPVRLECFDISHTRGEAPVASCVVFDAEGACRQEYRRFNIKGVTPGDDYGAMRAALTRRYARIKRGEYPAPDVLFVDGGVGQWHAARAVLDELDVPGVVLVAVAKGAGRKPGHETLYADTLEDPLRLPKQSVASHLVQQIRDEAHRFAITGHRKRRARRRAASPLEEIPGIGSKRRQALLRHFGGWQGVRDATARELARVSGVGTVLAQEIYDYLHESGP